jgi:type I restriction enzyme S subunit
MNNWIDTTLSIVAEVRLSNVDKKYNLDEIEVRLCNYMDVYRNQYIDSNKVNDFMIGSCNNNELENFKLRQGQVAITKDSEKRDDIGISTYIAEDLNDVVLGYHTSLITPKAEALSGKFLNYWFNTKFAKVYFENNAGGSGQRCTLPIDIIKSIPLRLPAVELQERIASVFYNIDSKIELNNYINSELEAMAKTIYDYWFVQFDFPDKNGKPYKTSGGKMVWNEELKREVPECWEVKELSQIANITMGQSPPGESYNEEKNGTIFYQGCTDFGKRFPSIRKYTTLPTRFASVNDILLSVRAPVGTMNIAKEDCCIGRGLAALNSKDNCMPYLFGVMSNLKQIFDRRNTDGTTFGAITKDDLFSINVIYPSKELISQFDNLVGPMFNQQNINEFQNIELTELRDWLLPMLMNGQVRVGN